jgi:hypothetical protein
MPLGCAILLVAFMLDLRHSVARLLGRARVAPEPEKPDFEVLS